MTAILIAVLQAVGCPLSSHVEIAGKLVSCWL